MRTDSKVSSRQIVLFIVEGKSDKEALEMIFKFIYRNQHEIRFEFTHGDITSAPEATLETAVEDIQRKIAEVKDDIKADDDQFCRIVQIFDMDGAYIPDSAIVRKQVESFEYSLASIAYKDITTVMGRNQKKSYIMNMLLQMDKINGIPYEKYFMSCNLDHVLYNEPNLPETDKELYAQVFAEQIKDRPGKFRKHLQGASAEVPHDMEKSWHFIRTGLHSLERHTNLLLYLDEHPPLFI